MDTNTSSMAFFKNMKCNGRPTSSTSSSRSSGSFFSFKSSNKASRASQIGPLNLGSEKVMSSNNSSSSSLSRA
ncbi:hypothetical protein EMPS_02804 [Entomortierella parvispora]|uniref:Uncharacterized protein n=1 Tax=Entomortierella parvispora TaxID=205924 RepID=A0A9P3H5F6_9FUNG|nr:hypothetical protein EMPS_02804 [Entomortierella parvispora]